MGLWKEYFQPYFNHFLQLSFFYKTNREEEEKEEEEEAYVLTSDIWGFHIHAAGITSRSISS